MAVFARRSAAASADEDQPFEALRGALRLIRSRRVGPATYHRLVAEEGSVEAALAALPARAAAAGVTGYEPCPEGVARAEWAAARRAGARGLVYGAPGYPAALYDLPDAPPLLWLRGDVALLARPALALVGARNASSLGLRMAQRLGEALGAAGFTVVSGLARGIDAAAHRGALPHGTVAVLAGGVDVAYPEENAGLLAEIAEKGAVLSEQPPGFAPQARHFPLRNRLISGLGRAVIVVEAAPKSGSLLTAGLALEQGREVMAVPGHPVDPRAGGCNQLIRDGALLVRGAEDILAALGEGGERRQSAPPRRAAPKPPSPGTEPKQMAPPPSEADLAAAILGQLGPSPLGEDQLLRDLARPHAEVAGALLILELEGKVERLPGGLLARRAY